MTKIRMLVELDYDAEIMHSGEKDKDAKDWFFGVLKNDGLTLHDTDDEIGDVTVIEIIPDVVFQNGGDYIDHAIKQLENQNTISGTFARQQYNELKASQMPTEWSKEEPTKPGTYKAKEKMADGSIVTRWVEVEAQPFLWAYVFGVESPFALSDFSEWLGPFPTMDGEK